MNIRIATSIKYGNYKEELTRSNELSGRITKNWERLVDHVGLDDMMTDNLEILIRPIKGDINGRYFHEGIHTGVEQGSSRIEVDPRYHSMRQLLGIIAHELQHCKQYYTGKLKHDWNDTKQKWESYWEGSKARQGTTYKLYRQRPWEIEARKVQKSFEERIAPVRTLKNIKV
jgi:hypothetical protein